MGEDRLVQQTVKMMYDNRKDGDLLMDAPQTVVWEELKKMATADKGKLCQQLVRQIKDTVYIQAAKGDKKKKKQSKKSQEHKKKKKKKGGEEVKAKSKKVAAERTSEEEEDSDEDGG